MEGGAISRRIRTLTILGVVLAVVAGATTVYVAYFSMAARAAARLPVGAEDADVPKVAGARLLGVDIDGDVQNAYLQFSDASRLYCVFVTKTRIVEQPEVVMVRKQIGTLPRQRLVGYDSWGFAQYETYQEPMYGNVPEIRQKKVSVSYWALSKTTLGVGLPDWLTRPRTGAAVPQPPYGRLPGALSDE